MSMSGLFISVRIKTIRLCIFCFFTLIMLGLFYIYSPLVRSICTTHPYFTWEGRSSSRRVQTTKCVCLTYNIIIARVHNRRTFHNAEGVISRLPLCPFHSIAGIRTRVTYCFNDNIVLRAEQTSRRTHIKPKSNDIRVDDPSWARSGCVFSHCFFAARTTRKKNNNK